MNNEQALYEKAKEVFYAWEQKNYPNGDTPFSDDDRYMFMDGWVEGYRFLNSGNQNVIEEIGT